jgi:dTDP-4-amino-4,6-dideoxygalactose transaminase
MSSTSSLLQRSAFLPFALPDLDGREADAVRVVLESGWLTTGEKAKLFETRFAAQVGAKHAIAVNSCTAAMHLALEAIGLQRGDEVITTPYTFAATAEVIRYFDARPVFVDIESDSLNIDAARVAGAITGRTRAIIPVHVGGLAADLDALSEAAAPQSIAIIEDAAHAFPTTHRGRAVGSISDFTCFSFYATKTITTGEGGMICTNSDEYAERCRMMSLHGLSKGAWSRYTSSGSWKYEIVAPGYKYNLTDIAAAIGLVQLDKADEMHRRREEIARAYDKAFAGLDALQLPHRNKRDVHAWHLYPLRIHADRLRITRDAFIEELRRRSVGTSVHFIPLHLHRYYADTYRLQPADFPVALREFEREISLPIYSRMSSDDADHVVNAVSEIVRTNAA